MQDVPYSREIASSNPGYVTAERCPGREGLGRQGNPRLSAHRPLWPIGRLWFCSGTARSVLSSGTIGLVALLWIRSAKNDGLARARFGGRVFQLPFPESAGGLRAISLPTSDGVSEEEQTSPGKVEVGHLERGWNHDAQRHRPRREALWQSRIGQRWLPSLTNGNGTERTKGGVAQGSVLSGKRCSNLQQGAKPPAPAPRPSKSTSPPGPSKRPAEGGKKAPAPSQEHLSGGKGEKAPEVAGPSAPPESVPGEKAAEWTVVTRRKKKAAARSTGEVKRGETKPTTAPSGGRSGGVPDKETPSMEPPARKGGKAA
ncbi:UNVERIFIED_CONTAM: hypothetical protein FKN15_016823 [Acipenser sinensis]